MAIDMRVADHHSSMITPSPLRKRSQHVTGRRAGLELHRQLLEGPCHANLVRNQLVKLRHVCPHY